ncbi:unnamed protein product, partial [Prorocentrum cordatum]
VATPGSPPAGAPRSRPVGAASTPGATTPGSLFLQPEDSLQAAPAARAGAGAATPPRREARRSSNKMWPDAARRSLLLLVGWHPCEIVFALTVDP